MGCSLLILISGGGLRGGLEMAGRYDANVRNPIRIPHAFDLRN
jgi:hypothetical protein